MNESIKAKDSTTRQRVAAVCRHREEHEHRVVRACVADLFVSILNCRMMLDSAASQPIGRDGSRLFRTEFAIWSAPKCRGLPINRPFRAGVRGAGESEGGGLHPGRSISAGGVGDKISTYGRTMGGRASGSGLARADISLDRPAAPALSGFRALIAAANVKKEI